MVTLFEDNDAIYQDWLLNNPNGWVLNVRRNLTPSYMVLYSAPCTSVTGVTPSSALNSALIASNSAAVLSSHPLALIATHPLRIARSPGH